MSTSLSRTIYLLYGSQTGNAESIAQDLSDKFRRGGFDNQCLALNEAKKLPMKELASCLIIICSTTGNGDAPENCEGWWRSVKLRSAVRLEFDRK